MTNFPIPENFESMINLVKNDLKKLNSVNIPESTSVSKEDLR